MKLNIHHWSIKLVCLLFATDILFIVIHLIFAYFDISNPDLSIEKDRGYAEIFQYIKEYWIALILAFLALRWRSFLYLSWSLLFLYLLIDDSFQAHETLSKYICIEGTHLGYFSCSMPSLLEPIVSAIVGIFFLICISISYYYSNRVSRKISKTLIVMLFSLVFFGVLLDIIHGLVRIHLLHFLLACLEDGGEMIVMSSIASFVFLLPERLELENKSLEVTAKNHRRVLSKKLID